MKRIIFIGIVLLAILSFNLNAQSEKASRKEKREKAEAEALLQLKEGIRSQYFTFTALSMTQNYLLGQMNTSANNYVRFRPNYIGIALPYRSFSVIPNRPYFIRIEDANYGFKIDSTTTAGVWYVNVNLNNALNQSASGVSLGLVSDYQLQFKIDLSTTNAMLTVSPSYYTSVTYNGFVSTVE